MRIIRTVAFAAAICTLAACAASPTLPTSATGGLSRDNGGLMGSGNNTAVPAGPSFDGTTTDAPGTVGSGNRIESGTSTASPSTTDPATMGSGNLLEAPGTVGSGN
jgi:hypothetical protein